MERENNKRNGGEPWEKELEVIEKLKKEPIRFGCLGVGLWTVAFIVLAFLILYNFFLK